MTEKYDLVAIGSGPAGESATELAAFFGHRSAVIERARPGGTVTTTGGAPTKTLREAAVYFSGLREGDVYGLRMTTPPEIVTDTIRKRTWDVCELLQKVTAENIANNNVDYIQGEARFSSDGSVVVTAPEGQERKLRAKAVLIATGSRPTVGSGGHSGSSGTRRCRSVYSWRRGRASIAAWAGCPRPRAHWRVRHQTLSHIQGG